MNGTFATAALYGLGTLGAAAAAAAAKSRLDLLRAKHRSLGGHARIARGVAKLLPSYQYDDGRIFKVDGAPDTVATARRDDFHRLAALFLSRHPRTLHLTHETIGLISDMQFTEAYRVPFQFSPYVRQHLPVGTFVESSAGVKVTDLDGSEFYDLTGAYGVNLFGHDFYKDCIARAVERVGALGPVLGPYHPIIADNVNRLTRISGMDEVSFHMSGTEAVMQAVRLARYHTRRTHLVRFCGAYHGWWDDVQPGPGNPVAVRETYTLKDMSNSTLRVLRRRTDIACVLVNPVQSMHLNKPAPADSTLVDSARRAAFDRAAYTEWLKKLRSVCSERGIVLIFDEVFAGFRLALGGAQEYFGVAADLVTYGKTLGGGLPIGAVCGRRHLMKRFRDDRPADICFARGTFNSHPYVMASANEFLLRLEEPEVAALYDTLDAVWDRRAAQLNQRLHAAGLPVRVANLSSIWIIYYTQSSSYNWMFQYYLRAQGLALNWTGTGRLIFSLNYSEADFEAVTERIVTAAQAMQQAGWWWADPRASDNSIRRRILREILSHRLLPARPGK
ncbi:MAG: aminotransferase class III-fold pyridoxal phosphate-dependent enzyme [Alphaproteobacteria bacterium]|nr:aminotransferase class III-fold pyridoxal phosphate-dependent enzyme [Alphaproteobacteria bacterium]